MRLALPAAVAIAVGLAPGLIAAQDGPSPEERAIDARQSHMTLYAWNLGTLGAMAQGAVPFEAEAATRAAENLSRMVALDQTGYWLEGTSTEDFEESQALPAIWEDPEGFEARHTALEEAVANLVAAAAQDAAALGGALGGVGQACGACHQNYREAAQ